MVASPSAYRPGSTGEPVLCQLLPIDPLARRPALEQPLHVPGHDVDLEIDRRAEGQLRQGDVGLGVGDEGDGQTAGLDARDGQAGSVHGDKGAGFAPMAIPAVIFTDPEVAWAGLTETEAKAAGREVKIAKFPWAASGRATSIDRSDGVTKIVIDPEDERILGIGICGPGAGELIAEGTLAIEMGATVSDLKLTIHPHPTLSETVMEAAEVFFGQSTHLYRPKK